MCFLPSISAPHLIRLNQVRLKLTRKCSFRKNLSIRLYNIFLLFFGEYRYYALLVLYEHQLPGAATDVLEVAACKNIEIIFDRCFLQQINERGGGL